MRDTLGEHVFESFLANKRIEWQAFRVHVTDFERERYLPIL
jgi:glutamine synthetase